VTLQTLTGRVWRFGHDVDTDVMAPWATIAAPFTERRHRILAIRPEFASGVGAGDVIVAGRNWGCGSSREPAPENLRLLGVAAVVAESFGRIYFRNSIAIAFPNIACPGVYAAFGDGDQLELSVEAARVRNLTTGVELQGRTWTPDMLAIVAAGGLLEVLKARLADEGVTGPAGGLSEVAVRNRSAEGAR
jgi:3-isopropylmalate dehydratase small subunit